MTRESFLDILTHLFARVLTYSSLLKDGDSTAGYVVPLVTCPRHVLNGIQCHKPNVPLWMASWQRIPRTYLRFLGLSQHWKQTKNLGPYICAKESFPGLRMEQVPSLELNKISKHSLGRASVLLHPSLYRTLKLTSPQTLVGFLKMDRWHPKWALVA